MPRWLLRPKMNHGPRLLEISTLEPRPITHEMQIPRSRWSLWDPSTAPSATGPGGSMFVPHVAALTQLSRRVNPYVPRVLAWATQLREGGDDVNAMGTNSRALVPAVPMMVVSTLYCELSFSLEFQTLRWEMPAWTALSEGRDERRQRGT